MDVEAMPMWDSRRIENILMGMQGSVRGEEKYERLFLIIKSNQIDIDVNVYVCFCEKVFLKGK